MPRSETELLEELLKWQKFMARPAARETINEALSHDDEEKEQAAKITYSLTNGENTTKDIEKHIPFSYKWVSDRHQEWAKLGIVEKNGAQDPYEQILSLEELGIDSPKIPEPVEA